jgi:protocatechuate 3,4-dioxygenase beta subunit
MFVVDGAWTRLTAVAWADGSTSQLVTRDSFAAELEIALAPSRCMHGVVRDGVSGLPIAGAEICVWTHARSDSVQSAGDGTFVHPRLPASGPRQQVRASAPGYAPYVALVECDAFDGTRTWSGPDADARVHGRDADARVEFALWPEARIHGRVLGPGGEPITGARVRAQGYALLISGAATPDSAETCTRADGSYQLAGLRPDIAHAVFVEAAPFAAQLFELASGAEHALDVRMDLGAALSGQILDPAGLPAEGLHVELRRLDAPKAAAGGPASAPPRSLGRRDSRTADFAGYFEFEGLGTHRYQLRVLRGQTPLHVQDFVPEQGERIALPPLTLDSRWLTLRGTVDPGHAEIRVAGSRVEAWREIPLGSVHVDGDGSFRIAGLDARAPYELRWYAGDDAGRMLGVTRSWAHETARLSPLGPSE